MHACRPLGRGRAAVLAWGGGVPLAGAVRGAAALAGVQRSGAGRGAGGATLCREMEEREAWSG